MATFAQVNDRFRALMKKLGGSSTERAITMMQIAAGDYSARLTPQATSTLINSQYRVVNPVAGGWSGELGYTADYAKYVHEAPGTLLNTGTPRNPSSLGTVWGPSAEPQFLSKGVRSMIVNDSEAIIRGAYN